MALTPTSAATRCVVLTSALHLILILNIEVTESRRSTRRCWWRSSHAHVGHCRLVAAMSRSAHATSHGYAELLLCELLLCQLLLLLELELIGVGRDVHVLHLALQLLKLRRQLLLRWDDAHVDELLVLGGDSLLFLLEHLNLLCKSKLLHCGTQTGEQMVQAVTWNRCR